MISPQVTSPQVILIDAVGTLFGVKGSVGEIYLNVTRRFGVDLDAKQLDQAFYDSFNSSPFPMAFPGVAMEAIPQKEYEWWETIARDTFQRAGVYEQFTDFSAFFAQLYQYFAGTEPWFIYPDAMRFLEHWHSKGVPLGVLSNFDTRIHAVLASLDLAKYFASVTISTEVGAAKPDPLIFEAALAKHNCAPEQAWHIGDSFNEDYQGAKQAGIQAIWLKRAD